MEEIREAISEDRFDVFYQEYVAGLDSSVPIC
jgi:queuine/archaeosine tRNA-ribosyltransferase